MSFAQRLKREKQRAQAMINQLCLHLLSFSHLQAVLSHSLTLSET